MNGNFASKAHKQGKLLYSLNYPSSSYTSSSYASSSYASSSYAISSYARSSYASSSYASSNYAIFQVTLVQVTVRLSSNSTNRESTPRHCLFFCKQIEMTTAASLSLQLSLESKKLCFVGYIL